MAASLPGPPGLTQSLADLHPLIAIVGPTGSGKSDLALAAAEEFSGEIVNCDSLQLYRYFDIGTAKVLPNARRGIPHHLIDVLDPDQIFTAGEYARAARRELSAISERGRLPIVAGGTGFYLRALLDGLFPGPPRDPELRERLIHREARRRGSVHRILRRFDPEAARRIHPNDVPKTIRALEICLLTRRPATELFREGRDALHGYGVLKLGLDPDRALLYRRLDERCRAMFSSGLTEEVKRILAMGFPETSKPFESHGYRQAFQLLRGELSAAEALTLAQRNTRHYAKRQMTWFRREPGVVWLRGFGDEPQVAAAAFEQIRVFLHSSGPAAA